MSDDNTAQAEFWASDQGRKWITNEEFMDVSLAPVLDLVLERAAPAPEQAILDVGCGTGASCLSLADRVGPSGRVLGVDISAPLLERARSRAMAGHVAQVDFLLGDAQSVPLPGPFDQMVSRFGVMFFADTTAAFANIARALRPGAQLTFAAWGSVSANPWFGVPLVAAKTRLGTPPPIDRNAPGPFAFHDGARICDLLEQAGLTEVSVTSEHVLLTPPGDGHIVADMTFQIGPISRIMEYFSGTENDAAAIRDATAEGFARFATPDGLRVPADINLFTCRRAA